MGQTLTHGVYLPDEGERNCYSGLASNWQILDTSVGTIAEHTSALSGKAPLVHTHVKSDITDLFNSANTWTDLQSYTQSVKFKVNLTIGAAPSSDVYGGFNFGNAGTNIGNVTARVSSAGATYSRLYIGNKFANGALDPNGTWKYTELQVGLRANGDKYLYTDGSWRNDLLPHDNNTYDLGSSSYKWKSLNGINPGALSLPNLSSDGYIDLSDNISVNTEYSYTPTVDGWLALYVQTTGFHTDNAVGIFTGGGSSSSYRWACSVTSAINLPRASRYNGAVILPVKAGIPYLCWITIDSSTALLSKRLYFYKATGNV